MDSDRPDPDAPPQNLAVKARMAQHAFDPTEGVDLRSAVILSENKLLPDGLETFAPDADILAAIRNPRDPNRIQTPDGPLVAVKMPGGGASASIVTAAEFLLSDLPDARQAALGHLDSLAACRPPVLTQRSRGVLAKRRADLLSADSWRRAAVETLDVLDEDFLYSLSGLRQCVAIDYREGATHYAPRVLRPSLTSVNAIPFGVGSPSRERERVLALIDGSVQASASVAALCDDYYTNFGHLPLTGDLSLGAAVRKWAASRGVEEAMWAGVWSWADGVGGPLPRYHACQVFVENPTHVPAEGKGKLSREILELLAPSEKGAEGLKWGLSWRLRYELLTHYAAHLECLAPGEDGERVAVAALWVTERVAEALSHPSVDVQRLLDQTVTPTGQYSRAIWQTARPPAGPSSLRYAALFGPSLWSLSILGEIGGRIRELLASPDGSAQERVKDALMRWLMQIFPPPPRPETPTYAFDKSVMESADAWVLPLPGEDENLVGAIRTLAECQRTLADRERLDGEIRRLPSLDEANQYIVAQAVRTMAYTAKLPPDVMRECLWNEEWLLGILSKMSPASLSALWDGVVDLQLQQGGDWLSQLPHSLVRSCGFFEPGGDRFGEVVDLAVLVSMNAGAASALTRLADELGPSVAENLGQWKLRIESMVRIASPWPQAKLRGFLSALPPLPEPKGDPSDGMPSAGEDLPGSSQE